MRLECASREKVECGSRERGGKRVEVCEWEESGVESVSMERMK